MDGLPALLTSILTQCEYLYRRLAKQSHGDGADGLDAVFGDWPRLPDDFEPFHSTCVTEGGQPNNGAR